MYPRVMNKGYGDEPITKNPRSGAWVSITKRISILVSQEQTLPNH